MKFHGWIAEENPSAANVVVRSAGLCLKDQLAERFAGMSARVARVTRDSWWPAELVGEARRGPDSDSTAIGRQEQGLGEAICVNILEEAVEAIHQEINGETAAVGEGGGVGAVKEIGEGPLLLESRVPDS